MNKWTKFFLRIAKLYSTQSKDPSTKVGAIIAQGKHQVGQGYNGFPQRIPDLSEILSNRELKLKITKHAERNAILRSRKEDMIGATIYVTAPPCPQCAGDIIQANIEKVVYIEGTDDFMERYKEDNELSAWMFKKAEIQVISFTKVQGDEIFKKILL